MAGDTEFSIDLAAKAVERMPGPVRDSHPTTSICYLRNISRCDGPIISFLSSRSTAARLPHNSDFAMP